MRLRRSRNLNLKSILSRPTTTKGSERSRRKLSIPQNQLLLISLLSLLRLQNNSNRL
jgi:hypothetical protein